MNRIKNILVQHKNKLVTLSDQGLVSGINFLVGILLARWIGLENYGIYALIWMVVLFVSSVHQSAFISSLFALLPRKENPNQFINQLMGLQVIFSCLACGSIIFLGITLGGTIESIADISETSPANLTNLFLTAAIASVFVLNDFLRRVGFAKQQSKLVLSMDLIGYGLQPLLLFTLNTNDLLDVQGTLAALFFSYSISSLIGIIRLQCIPTFKDIAAVTLEVWSYSRFLIGTSLLQWLSGNFYLLTAAGVLGPVALGAIRIAQNVMGIMHLLLLSLENLVPLKAAETLHKKGRSATVKYVFRIFLQAAVPFVGLLVPIAFFRAELLALIYGNSYVDYAFVLLGFCGIYILIFIGTQLRFLIRTFERNNLIFWSYVATSILGLSTANYFVTQFQIYGVLAGIALTQIIMVGFYLFSLKSELKWLIK